MAFLTAGLRSSFSLPQLAKLAFPLRGVFTAPSYNQKNEPLAAVESKQEPSSTDYKTIFKNVNNLIASNSSSRLFAVVHLCGKQFKVTSGDIILVEGYWPPTIGDRLRLEKVLLVGGNEFTLIGRPVLDKGLVDVQATVIEKTLTHTKTHFKKKRRKQYLRINFQRSPNTMIRINSIEVSPKVNEGKGEQCPDIF